MQKRSCALSPLLIVKKGHGMNRVIGARATMVSLQRGILIIWLMALILVLSACGGQAAQSSVRPQPDFPQEGLFIDPDIVKREMDRQADFLIVDVRPEPNYQKGHILGAINVPFYDMETRYKELPKDKWMVFY